MRCPHCGDETGHWERLYSGPSTLVKVIEKVTGCEEWHVLKTSADPKGEWECGGCNQAINCHPEELEDGE